MSEFVTQTTRIPAEPLPWWKVPSREWLGFLRKREEQVFLVLTLVIGALVGLTVVAFIWFTEHVALRVYPVGSPGWHRFFAPVIGSLAMGYLLFKYFPDARGSGVPQTKAALYARGGYISLSTVLGKFFCTSATLASGIPLGREGPSVQVGAGLSSLLGRARSLRTLPISSRNCAGSWPQTALASRRESCPFLGATGLVGGGPKA